MKAYEVQQGYIILSQAKMDGLNTEEKYRVIDVARKLKTYANEFEEFVKETQSKISDSKEANEIIGIEAEKVVELDIPKLGSIFDKMIEHNSWNVAQAILMEDLIK